MEILVMQCSRPSSNSVSLKSKLFFSQLHVFKYSQYVFYLYVGNQYSYPFEAIGVYVVIYTPN